MVAEKKALKKRSSAKADSVAAAPGIESRKRQFILEGKIKSCFCEGCGQISEKVFVGEWKPSDKPKEDDLLGLGSKNDVSSSGDETSQPQSAAENQYWIRCASCQQVYLLKEWQIQIDRELNLKELNPSDCQIYSPHGIYAQGDAVYHKGLEEVGVVREKNATGSGAHVIIVEFLKSGRKQLLENVQLNQGNPGKTDSLGDILKSKLKR
ncbi:MAG: hypothetical protein C1942_10135 [Prosthecochloris sp.]|uniref:hypothetical protein n=1 Tax=Prosthecochloris sp. TaxID=290513 RepID=UPI0013C8D759|nr:hypothetical protein [Prosthecochloris sp.]NEX13018.1 hypothetical protein [Prosthecochloris sp.]